MPLVAVASLAMLLAAGCGDDYSTMDGEGATQSNPNPPPSTPQTRNPSIEPINKGAQSTGTSGQSNTGSSNDRRRQ